MHTDNPAVTSGRFMRATTPTAANGSEPLTMPDDTLYATVRAIWTAANDLSFDAFCGWWEHYGPRLAAGRVGDHE